MTPFFKFRDQRRLRMRRRQSFTHLLVIVILIGLCSSAMAQGTLEDYVRAEKFLPKNVEKLVHNLRVNPNWIDEDGSRFWYRIRTRQGEKFILVNPEKKAQKPAFDHTQLAISLSKAMGKTVKPLELPFERFEYIEKGKAIKFKIEKDNWTCNLKTYECKKIDPDEPENPSESVSPNEKWIAFVKDFNLFVRLKATGEEFQLTTDGEDKYDYATTLSWYKLFNESQPEKDKPRISVRWSPDSRRLITLRSDRRKAKKLYLYQSMPEKGYRAVVYSYERALPGEKDLTMTEHVIFDVEAKKMIPVDLEPYASHLSGNPRWFKDSKRLYFTKTYRGYQAVDLMEIDAATGKTRVIIEERSTTNVDPTMMDMHMVEDGTEVLWTSERDGWNHIYLYDVKTGELKNQVTKGEFVVRNIAHVDEKARVIYFIASGRRKDRDPYFRHLYRVNFDGTNLILLTPEVAEHEIRFSPDGKFFIDNFSRVDLAPRSVLCRSYSGKTVKTLEEADISDLLATGWKRPEPFTVKARDGETDIYGLIYRPSNFDPEKKYPVIDASYTGPHTFRTPKSFYRAFRNSDQPIAELGFIVITIDGLGTAMRSKKFHDFSYKNLGDIGAKDHIIAMRRMAERYPYMDLTRVGIYGHSAGGYDAAHALLTHPEFYKVAVSSAGNHDHRMAKAWWPELWMGLPDGTHYDEQSNLTLAGNLQGKLLLVHGDMDNNVNPACSLRLAGELIKANKDFDLLIIPNRRHGLSDYPYFIRVRWDYFVKHLLGVEPPKEYKITLEE